MASRPRTRPVWPTTIRSRQGHFAKLPLPVGLPGIMSLMAIIKTGQRKDQADPESAAHVGQFRVFFLLTRLTFWFQGHAAFGATAGLVLQNFRVHGTGVDIRPLSGEHGLPVHHFCLPVYVLQGKLRDFSEIYVRQCIAAEIDCPLPHVQYDGGYPCQHPCRRPGLSGRFPPPLYPKEVFDHGDDTRAPDSCSVFLAWGFH